MKGFRNAVAFLTTLPVKGDERSMDHGMLQWFPAVGLLIGLLWAGFDAVVGLLVPPVVRAVLDLVFLILITGGLHLDGLADAADGILAHRGRERALEIMRDSRLGTWGGIALFCVLLLDWSALSVIVTRDHAWKFFLLAPAYGRLAMLFGMQALPYGRPEGGMASNMFGHKNPAPYWAAGLVLLSFVLYPGPICIAVNVMALAAVPGVIRIYRTTMGCITGDMVGGLGEIAQTAVLLALTIT